MTASRKSRPAPPSGRAAYLVLGMHRSGTSAATQLLALAGADLPANVMPGDEHNAKGYFEPWKIAQFNDERLRAAGSAWDDPFAFPFRPLPPDAEPDWRARAARLLAEEYGDAPWPLMKDPRATVLLPFWRQVLDDAGLGARCVVPVRHPRAVAASLKRRDRFPEEKSVLIWTSYMLAAEAYTRDLPRAFVGYDALLSDWRAEAARIEAAHGAPLPRLDEAAGREIDRFLSPDLRHNAGEAGLADLGWSGRIAQRALDWFEAAASGRAPAQAELEAVAAELAERAAEIGVLVTPAAHELAQARAELEAVRERLARAEALDEALRAEAERDRKVLEGQLAQALGAIERISGELDQALAGM